MLDTNLYITGLEQRVSKVNRLLCCSFWIHIHSLEREMTSTPWKFCQVTGGVMKGLRDGAYVSSPLRAPGASVPGTHNILTPTPSSPSWGFQERDYSELSLSANCIHPECCAKHLIEPCLI